MLIRLRLSSVTLKFSGLDHLVRLWVLPGTDCATNRSDAGKTQNRLLDLFKFDISSSKNEKLKMRQSNQGRIDQANFSDSSFKTLELSFCIACRACRSCSNDRSNETIDRQVIFEVRFQKYPAIFSNSQIDTGDHLPVACVQGPDSRPPFRVIEGTQFLWNIQNNLAQCLGKAPNFGFEQN